MKIVYDQEVDVLRVIFSESAIEESDEDKPGVILDYDADGNIVGLREHRWIRGPGCLKAYGESQGAGLHGDGLKG